VAAAHGLLCRVCAFLGVLVDWHFVTNEANKSFVFNTGYALVARFIGRRRNFWEAPEGHQIR